MPYILPADRPKLDEHIRPLADKISSAGELDYSVMKLLIAYTDGGGFSVFATGVGVLLLVIFEFVRRVVNDYENLKMLDNGDVF